MKKLRLLMFNFSKSDKKLEKEIEELNNRKKELVAEKLLGEK